MALTPSVFGLDREVQISQLHHTAWTDENAGLGAIKEVVQTSDGFLWLRTSDNRLLRFDGVRFQPIETTLVGAVPLADRWWESIAGLQAARGGGLWIAHEIHSTSIEFVKDGVDRAFPTQKCIPKGYPTGFAEEANGVLWIKTTEGLARLQNGHCEAIAKQWGYSGEYPLSLLVDRQGTLWVKASNGQLFFLRRNSNQFEVNLSGAGKPGPEGWLAQAPDGSIWQSGSYGLQRITQNQNDRSDKRALVRGPYCDVGRFLFDRDGALWFQAPGGLYRIAHPEALVPWQPRPSEYIQGNPPQSPKKAHAIIQAFTAEQGLSADEVGGIFEDREGSIWAGTASGLDQFRNNIFIKAALPRLAVQQIALSSGSAGSVWAGNWDSPVFHLGKELLGSDIVGKENIVTLYSDPSGVTWVGTPEAVWRSTTQGFRRAARSPVAGPEYVLAMSINPEGGLWVSFARTGIFLLRDGVWTRQNKQLEQSDDIAVDAIATDARGRVWFDSGDITVLDHDHVLHIETKKGYATSLNVTGSHTWMGGVSGLGLLMDGKLHVIRGIGDAPFRGVTGIIERASGDLWINTIAGVVRISAEEIKHAVVDDSHHVRFRRFDALDGLEGKASNWLPGPTATTASDGSFWFGTNKGVFRVDPDSLDRQVPLAPSVFVTSLTLGAKRLSAFGDVRLPPHSQNLQLEYTTPSFATPERLNFSYKLEGADREWQDVGTRRQAFYTNLSPGHYRFLVNASGDSTVSATTELRFVIEAAWYQTIWFRCLCALALIGALWCIYSLRLMQVTARFHERMGDRLRERERIARELHDTLLQGFQSIILRFQVTANAIAPGDTARSMMEDTLSRADAILIEGRHRVRDLRSQDDRDVDLADELRSFIAESGRENSGRIHFEVEGKEIPLHTVAKEEIFAIVREALFNAMRHSQASEIICKLHFSRKQLLCECYDNGIGIDPEVLAAGGKRDHWGLIGMRERARKVGAEIRVQRMSERGTRVEVRLPARIAFADKSQRVP